MIHKLITILFLSLFLALLPSCTIFGSGDLPDEEDYYDEEAEEMGDDVSEAEEEMGDDVSEEPIPMEEDDQVITSEMDDGIPEGTGEASEMDYDEGDIEYIDEEDEEYMIAEGVNVEVEDDVDEQEVVGDMEVADSDMSSDQDNAYGDDSGIFNQSESSFTPQEVAGGASQETTEQPVRTWIPYKKIKTSPYNKAGVLVNAVYIARPGEDIQSISNKIFGSNPGVDLLYAVNPHLKAREVKVGDKIYYQSPNRPQDSSRLLFYFEDIGMEANYQEIQAGQNIRTVASQLLGDPNSWKEIWATNPDIESKGDLDTAITVRYWPDSGQQPQPSIPQQPSMPEPEPEPEPEPQPEEDLSQQEEELVQDMQPGEEIDPTPVDQEMPEDTSNPPTPPEEDITNDGGGDKTEALPKEMLGAGALVLLAIIIAITLIKKRRAKRDFDYTVANFDVDE